MFARRIALSCLAVFAALAFLPGAPLAAQQLAQPRLTQPIVEGNRVALGGTVHPLARGQNDRGRVADGTQLDQLHVVLKRSDAQESQLKQLIGAMHSPGSPSYHKWLTPEQFGQQFGPSDADVQTLTAWLQAQGFTVQGLTPGRQTLTITGTAGAFRNAFHAEIHRYSVNGQTHFANASDPQIPAALAPVFGGFTSLNNFQIRSYSRRLGSASFDPVTHKATGDWTRTYGSSQDYVLSPGDFAVQYDIPNGLNAAATPTLSGSGQTIAIVNDSNINVYLVNQFRTLFGLPANPPQVIIDGSDPGIDGNNNPDGPNGDSLEAYLDVEWAGAVAPNATVDLVIAADTNLESGLVLALAHAIYTDAAPVVSLSFGSCELSLGSTNQFLSQLFEQAAAQGITVLVSSGDAGSAGCDDDNTESYAVDGQAVNGFASTPYNIAVGGTDFYYQNHSVGGTALTNELGTYWNQTASDTASSVSIKGYVPEQPWNNSQFGQDIINYYTTNGVTTIVGGGGGPSNCGLPTIGSSGQVSRCAPYPKPSWQTGVSGIPSDSARDTPDVSLFAANGANQSYYPVCADDGDCQPVSSGGQVQISGVGGTSASTPAFAGLMALINQKYGRQGQANYVLYPLAAQYPASFHDVMVGSNAVPCQLQTTNCISTTVPGPTGQGVIGSGSTQEYNAATGYDLATGLGSVDANVMIGNWNKITSPNPTTTTMTPSSTSFAHGANVSFSGTVAGSHGTPTGIVELKTDSNEPLQQTQYPMALTNGAFSLSNFIYLPGGTYNVWGEYSGDLNNAASASAKTSITVTPENSGLLFVTTVPSSQGISLLTDPSTPSYSNLPYGAEVTLFGLVAPSSQFTTFENCELLGNVTCPVFTAPTGTVTFLDSANNGSFATVINAAAEAEYSYPFTVGTHAFTAQYSGDNSYNASSATAQTVTVVKSTPSVGMTVASNNGAAQFTSGQATVVHVYLANNYNYGVPVLAPTGTITLTGVPPNLTTPVTATLSSAYNGADTYGVATFAVNPGTLTPAPDNVITVSYAGDANYSATTTQAGVQFLAAASGVASTTTATASANVTSPSAAVTLTLTVTGQNSGPAPTGTLALYSSAEGIGVYTLPAGSGNSATKVLTLNSESLLQGANLISVWYSGDGTYLPSVASVNIANGQADFALTPAASVVGMPSSGIATDQIALTSEFNFSGNVNLTCSAPTGVACSLGTSQGNSCPASASVALAAGGVGQATLTINTSSVGSIGNYPIVVTATDATGTIVHTLNISAQVTALAGVGFGLTSGCGGGTITLANPGANGTATITVTPTGGFTGNVALTCSVSSSPTGAAHAPTCSVSSPVSITGAAATAMLTVNTTASAEVRGAPLERMFGLGGAALAMLLFVGIPRRRRWHSLLGMVLLSSALLFGAIGCSSGSSGSSGGGSSTPTNTGTTYGSYGITVTGTSGSTTSSTVVTVVVN